MFFFSRKRQKKKETHESKTNEKWKFQEMENGIENENENESEYVIYFMRDSLDIIINVMKSWHRIIDDTNDVDDNNQCKSLFYIFPLNWRRSDSLQNRNGKNVSSKLRTRFMEIL